MNNIYPLFTLFDIPDTGKYMLAAYIIFGMLSIGYPLSLLIRWVSVLKKLKDKSKDKSY